MTLPPSDEPDGKSKTVHGIYGHLDTRHKLLPSVLVSDCNESVITGFDRPDSSILELPTTIDNLRDRFDATDPGPIYGIITRPSLPLDIINRHKMNRLIA